jgi:hypothetical protein
VVTEEARFSFSLLLDGRGGEHDIELAHKVIREDCPKLALHKLGKFFAQEIGVILGRLVTAPLDAGVLLVQSPRFR